MTTFWIMILPLLFIVLFVLVTIKLLKLLSNSMKINWAPKHIFFVVTGYISLGILAFVYLSFIYESELTTLSSDDIQKLEQVKEDDSSFLTETYKKKSWQFEFEGDVLPVKVNEDSNGLNSRISLRYNDEIEKGNVILSYYQFPVIIEGLDMTDEILPPNVYMAEQQLIIAPPSSHSIRYNRVNASLSILDFNRSSPDELTTVSYNQPSVLLIEVPRSTNLEDLINIIN